MAAIGASGGDGGGLASAAAAAALAPPPPSVTQAPAPASVGSGNASVDTGFDASALLVDTAERSLGGPDARKLYNGPVADPVASVQTAAAAYAQWSKPAC